MRVGIVNVVKNVPELLSRARRLNHLWNRRPIHTSQTLAAVRPFLLSDPGEGIKEVQLIQWFVKPGDKVEQFNKVCEVASDKANIEITSRFDGVIKKLHYEDDDVVQVGQALFDVDVQSAIAPEDGSELTLQPGGDAKTEPTTKQTPEVPEQREVNNASRPSSKGRYEANDEEGQAKLATPAVRALLKEAKIEIGQVIGTGKEGRILKEDVHRYIAERTSHSTRHDSTSLTPTTSSNQVEKPVPLTSIQAQMFKTMTRSLTIPHFLYTDEIDLTALSALRKRLNNNTTTATSSQPKLSYLHFIIKAVSLALTHHPLLNARLDPGDEISKPSLVMREKHNIGIAVDTPSGLLVPNIKDVAALSIRQIAAECQRLTALAREGKLTLKGLTGGTITVSNIGSIGGTVVAPVIVQGEVAILGVGRARDVPGFGKEGGVVRKRVGSFSWSADHRVVDGASMARMAEVVRGLVEEPEGMGEFVG